MRDIWDSVLSIKPGTMLVEYRGSVPGMFVLCAWTGFLTVLTLGVYRFWAVARQRRYTWSGMAPGGDPLEYTGTGGEALRAFAIAVVGVVLYLLAVNATLFQLGMLTWPRIGAGLRDIRLDIAIVASLVALLPLIGFARYRARQYVLSRTRWRGLRPSMAEGAAVRYALLWLVLTALGIASLGLLWPLRDFALERFLANRTRLGSLQLTQRGSWTSLYPPFVPLVASAVGAAAVLGWLDIPGLAGRAVDIWAVALVAGSFVHYRVQAFAVLTGQKRLGRNVRLHAEPETGGVILILLISAIVVAVFFVLLVLLAAAGLAAGHLVQAAFSGWSPLGGQWPPGGPAIPWAGLATPGAPPPPVLLGLAVPILVLCAALWTALARQQILSHLVTSVELSRTEELESAGRARATGAADADDPADLPGLTPAF